LVGFGRRPLQASPAEVRTDVLYQLGAAFAFCRALGVPLQHVKPHGALYNMALVDRALADAVAQAAAAFERDLILVAIRGSELARAGEAAGLRVAWEGFADRNYNPDGTLVDRSRPDAVIHDADLVARRVLRMVGEGVVEAVDGTVINHPVHTICIHGDNPAAVELARAVRRRLEEGSIRILPMARVLG
ncbi:MAG TPA: 5-oxoprolinase subunit PxpA, partial [Bacillota bacterium]